jgi:predicted RNA-binding protein YlqC (UPF0109 family)
MQEFIEFIAKSLVNSPDKVTVEKLEDQDGQERYLLHVEPKDRGKIIGREGKNIKSFRILLGAAAAKLGRRASFDIYDENRKRSGTKRRDERESDQNR